jgi:hypothetical protein
VSDAHVFLFALLAEVLQIEIVHARHFVMWLQPGV